MGYIYSIENLINNKKYSFRELKARKTNAQKLTLVNIITKEEKEFKSQLEASKFLDCSPSLFSMIKIGRVKTIKGYKVK